MSYARVKQYLDDQIAEIRSAGLYKGERVLTSPQRARVGVAGRDALLNLCANNYLGLADHAEVRAAARDAVDRWGYGMASVRFICGTQEPHKQLERALSEFLGTDDTILYSSCWDANGGLFETLLGRRGRGDFRRAEPRLDHRRRAALQGPAAIVIATTTWPTWRPSSRRPAGPVSA